MRISGNRPLTAVGMGNYAQFAYYLAGFPWYEGNILFAFAVAAQVLTWCETRSGGVQQRPFF